MNEFDLQRVHKYKKYIRDSIIKTGKRFVNLDNGSGGGSHWTCFILKDNKSYYFDSFGGQPDKLLLNQKPTQFVYHNYKNQDVKSKLCGS